jgi:hypothetical protein
LWNTVGICFIHLLQTHLTTSIVLILFWKTNTPPTSTHKKYQENQPLMDHHQMLYARMNSYYENQ